MRSLARSADPTPSHATKPRAPLTRLRRNCTVGASVAAGAFAAAFVTDLVRGVRGDDMTMLGMEVASAAAGVLCGVTAVLSWMLPLVVEARQGDDVSWAWQLGAKVADAYPAARLNGGAPRTPNIR